MGIVLNQSLKNTIITYIGFGIGGINTIYFLFNINCYVRTIISNWCKFKFKKFFNSDLLTKVLENKVDKIEIDRLKSIYCTIQEF